VIYHFERHSLDTETRELRRENTLVDLEPQVFDLLQFLIRNRARVVSKDDLVAQVWKGRIVSDSTLSSRVTAVRQAVGDSGKDQRLIRTFARKGLRFVGDVREQAESAASGAAKFVPGASAGEARPSSSKGAGPDAAERRQLTIVACEVVEAAALATHLDPEDLRDVMSRCLAILEDRSSGTVVASLMAPIAGCLDTSGIRKHTKTTPSGRCAPVWKWFA
jgi:DNA-binding winged helix-turn-helix (wHTH) protein